MSAIDNPYWDAVRGNVTNDDYYVPVVGYYRNLDPLVTRHELVRRYSWTVTDPDTVEFVAKQSGGRLVDPMAGTGYWAWLLAQHGVDVASYDLHPPAVGDDRNGWHKNVAAHATVRMADAAESVLLHPDRTLLRSWPPYCFPAGMVLSAYQGDRVIYIGEGEEGCCGDDAMFATFARDWAEVAKHRPIQWWGMHDQVTVYERAPGGVR